MSLVSGHIEATIYRTEVRFCMNITYSNAGKLPNSIVTDYMLEYWVFKFGTERIRKKYGGSTIEQVKKAVTGMGMTFEKNIYNFSCIDACTSYIIKERVIMDIKEEDLYVG